MRITYKLDNATFHVTFFDGDDEYTGASHWEVKRKDLADIWAQNEFSLKEFNESPEAWEDDPDDPDDEMICPGSSDALVIFAAAASQCNPTEYELDYHGSAYWFFHDMVHAEYDSGDGSALYIDESSEMRALPEGAKRAAKHGVSISEIIRELAKVGPEFKERFKFDFDAVEAFLDEVEIVLK